MATPVLTVSMPMLEHNHNNDRTGTSIHFLIFAGFLFFPVKAKYEAT